MAIRSLKTGTFTRSGMAGNPVIMPGSYESIATVDVGAGGASSVTFSSIPSTYTHLQIRSFAKGSNSGEVIQIILNTDTTAGNYSRHMLYGNGASAAASWGSSAYIGPVNLSTTANIFTGAVTDILDYTNTNKYKTGRVLSGTDTNGAGVIEFDSFLWMNSSAITSIKLQVTAGTFSQYSTFALYGVN